MLLNCAGSRCRIVPVVEERGRGNRLWVIKWSVSETMGRIGGRLV